MNFPQNRDTSFLNADEASVIETAVRTAVMSILKLFCDVNEKRSHCYEAKLAEAERENAALKFQLKAAEQELQTLRQISSNYKISAEVTFSTDVEERQQDSASFRNVSEECDAVLVLKEEEPFYENKLFIKSERTEEYSAVNFEHPAIENAQIQTYGTHNNNIHLPNHSVNHDPVLSGSERRRLSRYENVRRYRERIRADPVKYLAWKEKNHLRAKIERHVDVHIKKVLRFKDKIMCRCRLPCRAEGHYHCPFCKRTVIRRLDMERHLVLSNSCSVETTTGCILSSVEPTTHHICGRTLIFTAVCASWSQIAAFTLGISAQRGHGLDQQSLHTSAVFNT